MEYGNAAVTLMVIAVVLCVLGLAFVATYYLDKAVNKSAR
jgi:hypothetical protein